MAKTKDQRWSEVHARALAEFDRIQTALRHERQQCVDDRRFYSLAGAQWEGDLEEQFANRPRYELNKVHLAVIRIINEYRNNRISVDFTPRDGSEDKFADTCDGLYRADEQASTANEAYDNAFEEAAGGGFGAWRLRTCYEDEYDEDNDCQRVIIEPIFDADSTVWFDLDARRQDKADAKRCYVLVPMTKEAYIEEYSDDPATWPSSLQKRYFDWSTPDLVYVAEYYEVEEKTELVHYYRGLLQTEEGAKDLRVTQKELDDDDKKLETLEATGFREVRQKREKTRKVRKWILSGGGVLEDCGLIAGKCIPIIPTYGKRWVVDGVERCMGHVRLAKDAQRLSNMLVSWLGEICARFDTEKPILTPEQIQGHATMWSRDNVDRYPYLLINPVTDANGNEQALPPIGFTKAPNVPPAMAAMFTIAEQGLQDILGGQQAGEQLQPNMSGKAVELIQNRLDMQTFIYMSNFAKAMQRSGEVWLSMMKDIVVEKDRRMKTLDANGKASSVVMNQPKVEEETGEMLLANDISKASYEVYVEVGPSSSSKRAATVRALTGMMQLSQDPETQQVLSGLALMNIEGEGIGDVRDYFRQRLLKMGAVKPSEEEAQQMAEAQQNAQPDPQSAWLMAGAEKAQADAAQSRAKTVDTIAAADKKRAETTKILAETEGTVQEQSLATLSALQGQLAPPKPFGSPTPGQGVEP